MYIYVSSAYLEAFSSGNVFITATSCLLHCASHPCPTVLYLWSYREIIPYMFSCSKYTYSILYIRTYMYGGYYIYVYVCVSTVYSYCI